MKITIRSADTFIRQMNAWIAHPFAAREKSNPAGLSHATKKTISRVKAWLDEHTPVTDRDQRTGIQALQDSLDFDRLWFERLDTEEQLIIIPVRKNSGAPDRGASLSYLLLEAGKSGKISKGNMVRFTPEDPSTVSLPLATFSRLFNEKALDCSGRFIFLTVTGRYLYEINYTNGAMHSFTLLRPETTIAEGRETDPVEIPDPGTRLNWYLVTTVYHQDGGIEIFEDCLAPGSPGLAEENKPIDLSLRTHCCYAPAKSA